MGFFLRKVAALTSVVKIAFFDSFNRTTGVGSDYSLPWGSGVSIQNGIYVRGTANGRGIVYVTPMNTADFYVEYTVVTVSGTGHFGGPILCFTATNDRYWLQVTGGYGAGAGVLRLDRNGTQFGADATGITITAGSRVRFEKRGGVLISYFITAAQLSAGDSILSYEKGRWIDPEPLLGLRSGIYWASANRDSDDLAIGDL